MHKAGGQFILRALLDYVGGSQQIGYHWPRKNIPPKFHDLPLLGVVRNPWDWYLSWFCFNQQKAGNRNPLYLIMSDGGRNDFASTTKNMICFGESSEKSLQRLNELRKMLPDTMEGNRGLGITKSCLEGVQDSFYTWQFRRMFSDDSGRLDGINFARLENLRVELLTFLVGVGVSVSQELKTFVATSEKQNSSTHDHYRQYYDDGLRALVEDNDRLFIEQFGYTFQSP
jgi:hypothetical protein